MAGRLGAVFQKLLMQDLMDPMQEGADGGIDMTAMLRILRQRWWIVFGCVVAALVVAIIYLAVVPYRYAVQMRVAPIAGTGGDGLSGKLSQFGGLAAAAGVALPETGGSGSFRLYVEALHSRDVADTIARDARLMHRIFYREWDPVARRWIPPGGGVHDVATAIKSLLGLPVLPWQPPGAARLAAWLNEQILIDQNVKIPVVTVSMFSADPALAIAVLNRLGESIDELLRQRTLVRTNNYIRYLTARLPTISLAEQRVAVAQALGEQERLKMVASSGQPYAAEVFEHPAASERPVTPNIGKTVAVALVLGLAAGIALAMLWGPPRRRAVP